MPRFFFFLLGAVLFTATVQAQNRPVDLYTISGQVVDSLTNEPVPYATVSVAFIQAPTQYVNAAACDGNGKFEIRLKAPGNYLLSIQSVGITTFFKPFNLTETDKKIDFGKLSVSEKAQAISEVTVAAQRPLVKVEIDKLIYSMEDDPEAKVNNTLEMLRKVPLITVDGEDKIQLKGSSNFKIFLNGKPSNMLSGQNISDVLKSMPANSIKNIEVITDPGAKYDAEGIGGIINIITSRNLFQGYQGNVSVNAGTFGGFGGNAYLTAKTGKLGLTGNFYYNNLRRPWGNYESVTEKYFNPQYYWENSEGRSKIKSMIYLLGNLEASYEFDTLRLLSLGVNMYNGNQDYISEVYNKTLNDKYGFEYSYKTDDNGKYEYGSTGVNLDYQRSTRKKGEFVTISYRFNNSPNDNGNYTYVKDLTGVMPYPVSNRWYDNNARTTEHTGQIDYTSPITPKHSIESGLKFIIRQNISKVKDHDMDENGAWKEKWPPNYNSDFEHISNIYAGYAGYAYKAQKFGFRTGLRAEATMQNVAFKIDRSKNFGVDYFNLVPSVTASYQLKPTQQMRAGYNLRIFRPSIWYLNPYVNDTNPYNISYGNPNLVPEKSHSFNLNYSYFSPKYTLNVSASYSYINNSIERYTFIDPENMDVKRQTYDNIGRSQRTGLFVNAGWTPNKKLRFNFNGGMNYADMKSAELGIANSGLTGNCYINAQLTLPKDFRINANGMVMSGRVMLQGKQSGYYFTSISANKDLLKKKMTIMLSFSNPFSKNLKYEMSTKDDYFSTNTTQYQQMREGRISISYRFGTMKETIKKVQRGINNDDMKSGGDGGGGGGSVPTGQ